LAAQNRLPEALERLDALVSEQQARPEAERPRALLARAQALRGKVLFSMRRTDEALEAVAQARELAPAEAENPDLAGLFLLAAGRSAEAEQALRQALALEPGLAEAWELLGTALANQGRPAEAVQAYEKALALGSKSDTLKENLEAARQRAEKRP